MLTIILDRAIVDGRKFTTLQFPYHSSLVERVRTIPGAKWDPSLRKWLVSARQNDSSSLRKHFQDMAIIDDSALSVTEKVESTQKHQHKYGTLSEETISQVAQFEQYLRVKRYSDNTIKTYKDAVLVFLKFFPGKRIEEITNNDLLEFNEKYILANGLSSSFQNQVINAVKLLFRRINHSSIDVEVVYRPKREYTLPNVLSKEEVNELLLGSKNIKHRSMLSLIYSCGLRRSELLNLKLIDVDSKRKVLVIRSGKGRKDRIAPLSERTISMLRDYYKTYKPGTWLFEGQMKGTAYSEKSLESVLKQALARTSIRKPVTLHWLRHSYATHLLENGTDLRYIQEILGHKSSKTTEIYTHVSTKSIQNIKSPFDDMEF